MLSEGFAVVVLAVCAVGVGVAILVLSEVIGPRRRDAEKSTVYECGVPLLDSARHPFHVKFYLVAILFILFDIEMIFLLPYAVLYRGMGVVGLVEIIFFIAILGFGLVYVWKRGALEWD